MKLILPFAQGISFQLAESCNCIICYPVYLKNLFLCKLGMNFITKMKDSDFSRMWFYYRNKIKQ